MNIYIFEYFDSYTGGSIVVLAEDIKQAKKLAKYEGFDVETDNIKCAWYRFLTSFPYNSGKWYSIETITELLSKEPLIKEVVLEELRTTPYSIKERPVYRPDWIWVWPNGKKIKEETLYLVYQAPLNIPEVPRVVSNTYYCA